MIEEFFKAHQYTTQAIAAAGTLATVVVSLALAWSAWRADRTKLKALATLLYLVEDPIDPKSALMNLGVTITNHGRFPLRACSFFWKLPFRDEIKPTRPPTMLGAVVGRIK